MSKPRPTNSAAADLHGIFSLLRLFLAFFIVLCLVWIGGVAFEGLDYEKLARQFLERFPLLKIIPFPEFYTVILEPKSWRYFIAPLGAMFAVFLGAAFYVKDIYALVRLRDAVHYLITSMFALLYPVVNVEAGVAHFIKGKNDLLDEIGGPGFATIQPGNAVMFRALRDPSNITLNSAYFLTPFETIGHIADLDDHHGDKAIVTALTRDGIKITLKDIHFRYRIFPEIKNTHPIRRSQSDPYPFDEQALWRMTYNLAVEEKGQELWRDAVSRVVVGGITDYVNDHDIDYLTAPREQAHDPRREIRHRLFFGGPRIGLRTLGAELLWVDIGHFSIDDDAVDEVRQNLWAADWLGDARVTRELGLAKRQTYHELGRAEAQAELIVAIAESLRLATNSLDPAENMRKILLVRTAQLLDTYSIEARKALEAPDHDHNG